MYSPDIISQRIARIESSEHIKLLRHPTDIIERGIAVLSDIYDPETERPRRRLTAPEAAFIRNECLLSMCDFRHWASHHARILLDGGGLGTPQLWDSQEIVMGYIERAEERAWEERAKGWPVRGIRVLLHKARQLGATSLGRLLTMHRMSFTRHITAMAASIDEDKVKELYDRDKRIYDNLPWWMRPSMLFDEKSAHIQFGSLDTTLLYQHSRQKSGLGQGRQIIVSHLTECASWEDRTNMIALDFIPTLPNDSLHTLCILESTAQGRGNWWHEYTEESRRGEHPEWTYVFVPWYAERKKYRLHPPDTWSPSAITEAHASKVRETSTEWCGHIVHLDREQLYWYELGRASAQKAGELNLFLTNYCATPEESYQHSTIASFSPELLDRLRLHARQPMTFAEPTYMREHDAAPGVSPA